MADYAAGDAYLRDLEAERRARHTPDPAAPATSHRPVVLMGPVKVGAGHTPGRLLPTWTGRQRCAPPPPTPGQPRGQ